MKLKKLLVLGMLITLTACSRTNLDKNSSITSSSSIYNESNLITSSAIREDISSSQLEDTSSSVTSSSSNISTSVSSSNVSSSVTSSSSSINTSVSSSNVSSSSLSTISSISSSASSSITSVNNKYVDLKDWKNYSFSDGKMGQLNPNWTYYYNTSKNPSNVQRGDEYGVDLHKPKQRMESPLFNPWEKVEINIKLRFVLRSSSSYKTVKNTPQLVISCYDEHRNKVGTEEIYISKDRVPSNDRNYYTLKLDVYNNKMYQFDLEFGTSVDYSNSKWYTYAINEISLKGWPYGKK